MGTINFTKQTIASLPIPNTGMVTYRDSKEAGLSIWVTAKGAKTFFVRKRIQGKDERVKLGNFPVMTVEQARSEALKAKAAIAGGANPNKAKALIRDEMTFKQLFEEYMERYSRPQKKSWEFDQREVNKFLPDWFGRKISSITPQEVSKLHARIGQQNGTTQANRLLERIKAIYNKAIEWGWHGTNPAAHIKKFKEKSRDRFLQPDELPAFWNALEAEQNEVAKDFIKIALLTGARKANVLAMRWSDINFVRAEWRIEETKNGDALTLPLVPRALEILKARRKATNGQWVFPSEHSSSGHYVDPKSAWNRILTASGLENLRIHDLRRTLGSFQAAQGTSLPIIGKTLGHKSQQSTAIYSRLNNDPVREAMLQATDSIFKGRL